ncbi:putative cell wall-binding protein [Leifsonia sp. AK011]|uniref:cell wall-binding repeat-containing protein n=1 Tax=Leifsonia sp. AK011 TaxID=2723075 RepID=UPI0015CCA9A3|nr:cell wall-binding repeat-containing protein [Leifsonia sp. AK011]NYF09139.1 putative cell wall-binding protein [Leifsonia sp. AK011]
MPDNTPTRPRTTSRWIAGIASVALALGGVAFTTDAATAASLQPIPNGVYLASPWVVPGGSVSVFFVGQTAECGTGYGDGYSYSWAFQGPSGTTPLATAGFGEGLWIGRSAAFRDAATWNPLPIGSSGPVSGKLLLTCTPSSGPAQTVSMDLVVRSTPPATIYHSPTAWTWYTPAGLVAGAPVTVNALGFKPGESVAVNLVNATKYFANGNFAGATATPVTVTADGEGAVTAVVTLPSGWSPSDELDALVAGGSSKYLLISGEGQPSNGDPSIALASTDTAFPGGAVTLAAGGFEAGETVAIGLHSASAQAYNLGTLTADGSGKISGSVYLPIALATGEYRVWAGARSEGYLLVNAPLTIGAKPSTDRIAGANRYETGVQIAQRVEPFTSGGRVYLASGIAFPDALGAGPLAAHFDGAVLLTNPTSLSPAVKAELERLKPAEVVVIGGDTAVSPAVFDIVKGLGFPHSTERIAGANRYETNRLIIDDVFPTATTAYIATGANFPDALAAGPAAIAEDGVVVLVNGANATLDAATVALLDGLDLTDIRVVGGPTTVSPGIESQLNGLYPGHVVRLAGADRYSTAALIVGAAWPDGAPEAILTSGVNFPDALGAGALGIPMLTSKPTCVPASVLAELGELQVSDVTLIGDPNALSTGVASFARC